MSKSAFLSLDEHHGEHVFSYYLNTVQ